MVYDESVHQGLDRYILYSYTLFACLYTVIGFTLAMGR